MERSKVTTKALPLLRVLRALQRKEGAITTRTASSEKINDTLKISTRTTHFSDPMLLTKCHLKNIKSCLKTQLSAAIHQDLIQTIRLRTRTTTCKKTSSLMESTRPTKEERTTTTRYHRKKPTRKSQIITKTHRFQLFNTSIVNTHTMVEILPTILMIWTQW